MWTQRVRGAIGIGLTWAAAWAPIGALTGLGAATAFGLPVDNVTKNYAVMFGVLGFVGGVLFSTVLRFAEGRRTFEQLSLPRFVVWGAVGGLLLGGLAVTIGLLGAGLTILGAVMVGASTLLGAGSAAGTLVVARAAQRGALLSSGGVAGSEMMGDRTRGRLDAAE